MKDIHIPLGFENLVAIAEIQRFKSKKPKPVEDDDEMWSHFCWAVLLGDAKKEAEVNYVFNILDGVGLLERDNLSPGWLVDASDILSDAKDDVSDDEPNPEGKRGAIKKVEAELSNAETTLKSADEIFDKRIPRIDAEYLRHISKWEEDKLIADISFQPELSTNPFKIPGVAYTKAILWMHGCGIGLDYIPDNGHSKKFLIECNSNWTNQDFFVINHRFKQVCNEIDTDVYYSGWTLWIYQSTKSLINSSKKKQVYKPIKMIKFMEENDWDINDVADRLSNIEDIVELEEILNGK